MLQNLDKVLDRLDASKDRLRAAVDSIQYLNLKLGISLQIIYNVDHWSEWILILFKSLTPKLLTEATKTWHIKKEKKYII